MENKKTRFSRPGWPGILSPRGSSHAFDPQGGQSKKHAMICFTCYEMGHTSSNFILPVNICRKLLTNTRNYCLWNAWEYPQQGIKR